MFPFQITFLDFPESDPVWIAVQDRIEKLDRHFPRIVRCEVLLSCPHRHRHTHRLFFVQILIRTPGEEIAINKSSKQNEAHTDIFVAIRDSFDAAERRLKQHNDFLRHHVKTHRPTEDMIFQSESKVQGLGFPEADAKNDMGLVEKGSM